LRNPAARATFQLGGQGRETTRRDRPSPNGRIADYRFTADREGRTWHLSCASRDDGLLPTARCKPIFEHLLAQGTAGIPPEPDEGTRAAPRPLGVALRLPAGCRVSTFAGGDGNVLCDDKSTALWLKIDADLFGDPIEPTTEAVRRSVPAPLTWAQSEPPRCTLAGTAARCRDLQLVGGAHPLRARLASATIGGSTRLVQCMILSDGDGASQICAQLIQR
jgi:hypothetical protein